MGQLIPVERLPHGTHGVLVYDEPAEQLPTALRFLRGGLARGDRCIYVYEDAPLSVLRRAVRAGGIDLAAEERRGALVFLSPRQWVPPGLSPQEALDLLTRRVEAAISDGFTGLHLLIGKTWLVAEAVGPEWEKAYEALSIPRLHRLAATIVCLFNSQHLSAEFLYETLHLHPWVIFDGDVQPNLFYQPAGHVLGKPSAEEQARWMLSQLRSLNAAEQERRLRAREFQALVEHTPDLIARFGPDLRLQYVNPACERALGRPAQQLFGLTSVEAALPIEDLSAWELTLRQVLRNGRELTIEVPIEAPVGRRLFQARLVPERSANGATESVLCVARDISQVREAEEARERLYAELLDREERLRTMMEAILLGTADARRRAAQAAALPRLTRREADILRLLVQGQTNQQIGRQLGLSAGTVRNNISRLLPKLGAVGRAHAAARAVELGLLD